MKRLVCALALLVSLAATAAANPIRFQPFDWLPGKDQVLHQEIISFFHLDTAHLPGLQQSPDGTLVIANPGGAPFAVAFAPFRPPAGTYTLRFEARATEESKASALLLTESLPFTATTEWASHAVSAIVPGDIGEGSVAFTLRKRKGQLEIRHLELLRLSFEPHVVEQDSHLHLTVGGTLPDGAYLHSSPPGKTVTWDIQDAAGRVLFQGDSVRLVPEERPPHGPAAEQGRLDEKGTLLVDGKPFFPIGLYGENSEAAIQTAIDLHLNLMLMAPDNDPQKWIPQARKHGLQVILGGGGTNGAELVRKYGALPLLGWAPVDEPASAKDMDPLYPTLAAADGRPVYQSNHAPDTFADVGRYCDVLAVDPYPFSSVPRPLLTVGAWMDRARAALSPGQAVWYIQQAFAEAPMWNHSPTPEQLHASTWIALNHGARGVVYYALHEIMDPSSADHKWDLRQHHDLYTAIQQEADDLSKLQEYLLSGMPRKLTSAFDAAWWPGGLLAVVNPSDRPQEGTIQLPRMPWPPPYGHALLPVQNLRPWNQTGPAVHLRDGCMALQLPPYAVALFVR